MLLAVTKQCQWNSNHADNKYVIHRHTCRGYISKDKLRKRNKNEHISGNSISWLKYIYNWSSSDHFWVEVLPWVRDKLVEGGITRGGVHIHPSVGSIARKFGFINWVINWVYYLIDHRERIKTADVSSVNFSSDNIENPKRLKYHSRRCLVRQNMFYGSIKFRISLPTQGPVVGKQIKS